MITIYYSPKCKHCLEAMEYLNSRHIPFNSHDLTLKENRDQRKFYRDNGFYYLPIIIHNKSNGLTKIYNGCRDKDLEEIFTYEIGRE